MTDTDKVNQGKKRPSPDGKCIPSRLCKFQELIQIYNKIYRFTPIRRLKKDFFK